MDYGGLERGGSKATDGVVNGFRKAGILDAIEI